MLKKEAKTLFLNQRKQYSKEEISQLSQKICNQFFNEISFENIKTIHCFLPIVSQNEVNTLLIIHALKKQYPHIVIAVPVCNEKDGSMKSYIYQPDELIKNNWNIEEPNVLIAQKVETKNIDIILIQMIIFDKKGHRVGYGKGFYDRFLSKCPTKTLKIGLCIEEPIDYIQDIHDGDIALDICITPNNLYRFNTTK